MEKKKITTSGAVNMLTPREKEVFSYLLTKRKTGEIAIAMGINDNTLHFHTKNVYKKLMVHSRHELVLQYVAYADRDADIENRSKKPQEEMA